MMKLSSNGTFVNGTRVGKGKNTKLRHGDEISLCSETTEGTIHWIYVLLDNTNVFTSQGYISFLFQDLMQKEKEQNQAATQVDEIIEPHKEDKKKDENKQVW